MKNLLLLLFFISLIAFSSCEKDDGGKLVTKNETVTMGTGYANDIYYRLSDGLSTTVSRTNWDIGFSVSSREASILVNNSSGVVLKEYPGEVLAWVSGAVDTAGYKGWSELYNSDTTWTIGAFNMNATEHPNYGWGEYSAITHNLAGVAMYIIKTRAGNCYKIWIENKLSVSQTYSVKYSNLNGENEHSVVIDAAGKNKNFVYYSIDDNSLVDREPDTDKWDLVFTKWIDNTIQYPVTGVLQNFDITASDVTSEDPEATEFPVDGFKTDISTIGADWKSFNMNTMSYEIDPVRVFFVKDLNDKVYRIIFTSFAGSSTGEVGFDISTKQ